MMPVSPRTRANVGNGPAVSRFRCPGLALTTLDHGCLAELHLTLTPMPGETWPDACRRLHDVLRDEGASVVNQLTFGNVAARAESLTDLNQEFGEVGWPMTWIEGSALTSSFWSGMQLWAVRGVPVEQLEVGGEILACQYQGDRCRRVWVGGLGPDNLGASRPEQTERTFERLVSVLAGTGTNLSHLARTWLFLDDILGWYDDFNRVRTDFYQSHHMFEGLVPASTGVGTRNSHDAAVMMMALAIQSLSCKPVAHEIASPAQCPATSYGSSFSRAVELTLGRCRHVLVSGTASIEPGGKSARPNDLLGQIELTFEVVENILKSRGLGFSDTSRAVAYLKNARGTQLFEDWLTRRGLRDLPLVSTVAAVCRDELLFELELDAATTA